MTRKRLIVMNDRIQYICHNAMGRAQDSKTSTASFLHKYRLTQDCETEHAFAAQYARVPLSRIEARSYHRLIECRDSTWT
jgi:hypothetical protein